MLAVLLEADFVALHQGSEPNVMWGVPMSHVPGKWKVRVGHGLWQHSCLIPRHELFGHAGGRTILMMGKGVGRLQTL